VENFEDSLVSLGRHIQRSHGLAFWIAFAREARQTAVIPRMGHRHPPDGHGGGRFPYFIRRMKMYQVMSTENVLYSDTGNYPARTQRPCSPPAVPAAAGQFLRLFRSATVGVNLDREYFVAARPEGLEAL